MINYKQRLKKIMPYLLAFFVPIIIILGYTIYQEIKLNHNFFSNGETFIVGDLHQQYISIYSNIKDILQGNASLFYSFNKDIGNEMITTISYYGMSPFNIMYIFIRKVDIPFFTFIIYLFKIGLCSTFSLYFFNYKYGKSKSHIIFALLYAFCGYCVIYYFHLMWLDVVYMTPLVLIGINKLIADKPLMYIITLSLSIIFNFYIAYMLYIFCVLYFIYELLIKYNIRNFQSYKNIILKFIKSSVLAIGISCIIIIPVIYGLSKVSRIQPQIENVYLGYENLFASLKHNFFKQLQIGNYSSEYIWFNYPPLYTGLISTILGFGYFFNKRIPKKEKKLSLFIIIIFIISVTLTIPNIVWQGFIYPNGYNGRFTFLFSIFLLSLSIKNYKAIDGVNKSYYLIFGIIFLLFNLSLFFDNSRPIVVENIIINCVFVILYLNLLYFFSLKNFKKIELFIISVIVIEIIYNYSTGILTKEKTDLPVNYKVYIESVCPKLNNLSKDFYRISGNENYGFIDSLLCNYHGTSSQITTNDIDYIKFRKKYGENVSFLGTYDNPNKLPILDSILGVKYIFTNIKDSESDYILIDNFYYIKKYLYKPINIKTSFYIYENPYAMNLGYLIPINHNEIYNQLQINTENSFDELNVLMKTLTGNNQDIMIEYPRKYEIKNGNIVYTFDINNNEKFIFLTNDYKINQYILGNPISDIIVLNKTKNIKTLLNSNAIIKIENEFSNENLEITTLENGIASLIPDKIYLYWFDKKAFEKDIDLLKKNELKNIRVKNNEVYGNIRLNKESVLFLSIPYDKNWTVYVNGKKSSYEKVVDKFMGIRLKKGNYQIKMVYHPKQFDLGLLISISSIICLIYMSYKRRI